MKKSEFFDYDKYLTSKSNKNKNPKEKFDKEEKIVKPEKVEAIKEPEKVEKVEIIEEKEIVNENTSDENEEAAVALNSSKVEDKELTEAVEEEKPIVEIAEKIEIKEIVDVPEGELPVLDIPQFNSEIPVEKKKSKHQKNKKKLPKVDPVGTIKNVIDEALDEDVAEIAEFSVTKNVDDNSQKKRPSFKRNMYFTVGVIVSILSIVGFFFTVSFFAGVIKDFADNTKQKEEFAQFIYPVVITDPASYNSNQQLSSDTVISAAIWDIILHGDKSKYPSEFETMSIPQVDVELHATKLFGKGLTIDHKTVGDVVLGFYYSPETKSYNVPVSPTYFPYSPIVENIRRDGDTYYLQVGYVSPSPDWLVTKKNSKPTPDKYMEYVLVKNSNNYYLQAINDVQIETTTKAK